MELHIPGRVEERSCALPNAADAAGRTGALYVDLKDAVRAWLIVRINQGNAATVQLDPKQATDAAGTGTKALTNNVPIFTNEDMQAGTAFTKQTDAKTFTTSAAMKEKQVIFQIDPASAMDVEGGFQFLSLTTGASNAANITGATVVVQKKAAN